MSAEKISVVITALESFQPTNNDTENVSMLYEIFRGFRSVASREEVMPAVFALLERFPEADLGSPGPLVHELEAIAGYQPLLRDSLHRQPTDLTVWMVNRILNSKLTDGERKLWLSELKSAGEHPRSPESTRESVRDFLAHQHS
jgi:hypothetical protein